MIGKTNSGSCGKPFESPSTALNVAVSDNILSMSYAPDKNYILKKDVEIKIQADASGLGDATAEDVIEGKTFTSANGLLITGTGAAALDTSDATASAETILKDYTAYVSGEKVTGTYVPIEEKGDSTVPEEYQSYVDVAKTMYGGEYSHIFVAENSDFITVALMTNQFSIETYNSETSLYTATGVYFCRYRKETKEWQGVDYTSSVSEGEHYIANIKYCDTVIMYGNTKIYPLGVFNTNDATATPDKVLAPYTFYARGQKMTGTMEGGSSSEQIYNGILYTPVITDNFAEVG